MKFVVYTESVKSIDGSHVSVISGIEKANIDRMATMREISPMAQKLSHLISEKIERGEISTSAEAEAEKARFGEEVARLFHEHEQFLCPDGCVLVDDVKAAELQCLILNARQGVAITIDGDEVQIVPPAVHVPEYTEDMAVRELLLTLIGTDVPVDEAVASIRKKFLDARAADKRPPSLAGRPFASGSSEVKP